MRILLDTSVLIWFLDGNPNLSKIRRQTIVNSQNEVLVSIASLWELSIKIGVGRLKLSRSLSEVIQQLASQNIGILPVQPGHVLQMNTLPFHHSDPFDRMLIAQSQVEFLSVMSHDSAFADYGIKLV